MPVTLPFQQFLASGRKLNYTHISITFKDQHSVPTVTSLVYLSHPGATKAQTTKLSGLHIFSLRSHEGPDYKIVRTTHLFSSQPRRPRLQNCPDYTSFLSGATKTQTTKLSGLHIFSLRSHEGPDYNTVRTTHLFSSEPRRPRLYTKLSRLHIFSLQSSVFYLRISYHSLPPCQPLSPFHP